jgi:nucleotidyltransferase substrate binding protein (TIGR01987 family)
MADFVLDLSPLSNAVARLDEGIARYQTDTSDTQIRDGLIQRFEFTYEISHKMLRRYMEMASATPAQFDGMPFQDVIRSGNEQGLLLGDWSRWRVFRDMRSKTSHTYDEAKALEVVAEIPAFLEEAKFLLSQLKDRTA